VRRSTPKAFSLALSFGQSRGVAPAEGAAASAQKRLAALLDYMGQVERTNRKPAFVVPVDHFCAFEEELEGVPGVEQNLTGEGDEVWLRIPRLREGEPPAPPALLAPWIETGRGPDRPPRLRPEGDAPNLPEGTQPPARPPANVLETILHTYVEAVWKPWADTERPRRRTIALYGRLFMLQQTMEAEGADAALELVWGIGVAQWAHPSGQRVCHPLVAQLVEITLDPQSLALEVRPRDRLPMLETDPYVALDAPGTGPLAALWRAHLERLGRPISPFEPADYAPVLKAAVGFLDANGSYWPDEARSRGARHDDRGLPPFDRRLVVTDTWVLFARKRSPNFLMEDVERLKAAVDRAESVPGGPAALVTEPANVVVEKRLPFFRGLCFVDDERVRREARELYFPKPYNDEQVSVVQRLEVSDGVVVQGPPGTGKTHTIANVICHYLATGRKVLVTSKGEPALAVLREQIPAAIRPLAVALLTDEKDGMRQFEHAVQTIANTIARIQPRDLERDVQSLRVHVDALHQKLATIDEDIATWARLHMRRVRFRSKDLLPEELAREVASSTGRYEWLPDRLSSQFVEPKFRDADIVALRNARVAIGADLVALAGPLPDAQALPDGEEIGRLHQEIARSRELDAELAADHAPAMAALSSDVAERADVLLRLVTEALALRDRLYEAPEVATPLHAAYRADDAARLAPLEALRETVEALDRERQRFVEQPVGVPPGAELDREFVEAVGRAAQGRSPTGFLPFGKGDLRAKLQAVTVSGLRPDKPEHWRHVATQIELRRQVRAAVARWNSAAGEFDLPVIDPADPDAFRILARHAEQVGLARRLVCGLELEIESLLGGVFDRTVAPRETLATREGLATLERTLARHLARARLAGAFTTLSGIAARFLGGSGPTIERFRAFLDNELGDPARPAAAVAVRWNGLVAELRRLESLRPALEEVRRVADLVENSGARLWAQALRTEPVTGTEDPWTPVDWHDAWQLRQAATFLQVIDGREALRRLQNQRRETEQELARSYLSLAEQKTWLEVHRNSPPSVKAALQAYLNAVKYIGKGTGVRAARYRREARSAMLEAYRAVPCWIMPHWRVSETLPAELGRFDLVVVDEASQSDLWALPALLRGAKLMIVGDDKQVSPDGIGLAEDRIRELKHRYLRDQPFGDQMTPEKSLYDLAKVVFSSELVVLREHFRCVAPVIEFSKREFYNHEIQPLRIPRASERLDPPLVDVLVKGASRRGDVNEAEARAIVAEIAAILADPACAGRSIGVVSLLGSEQAHRILQLIRDEIPPEEIIARRITVGDARTFQGKERDIMLASMVATPDAKMTATGAMYEQRFNVAASRARDRMILFRSVELSDLSHIDLKARLIEHFAKPFRQAEDAPVDPRDRCVTWFERAIHDALVRRGFRVLTQLEAGAYAIDLVVEGGDDQRLAIECDGDQYHGPERWGVDMARQRVLERAGWTFWRAFAASYVRDADAVLADLFRTLEAMGITPTATDRRAAPGGFTRTRVIAADPAGALVEERVAS
jgi:very-short-patch-repair endonuclease